MNRAEWMNGICHIWSRGRLISPSLPVGDDWYLNLGSQKRPTGRNLGGNRLVRVQRYCCRGILFAHAQFYKNWSSYHIPGEEYSRRVKYQTLLLAFTRASLLEVTLFTALPKDVWLNSVLYFLLQYQTYCSREKGEPSYYSTNSWHVHVQEKVGNRTAWNPFISRQSLSSGIGFVASSVAASVQKLHTWSFRLLAAPSPHKFSMGPLHSMNNTKITKEEQNIQGLPVLACADWELEGKQET